MIFRTFAIFFFAVFALAACKPSGPPPDIIKSQREDMEKAKALQEQMQRAADQRMKQADDSQDK